MSQNKIETKQQHKTKNVIKMLLGKEQKLKLHGFLFAFNGIGTILMKQSSSAYLLNHMDGPHRNSQDGRRNK